MEYKTIEELCDLERIELNNYLNSLDRNDMERQLRKVIQEEKVDTRISVTMRQLTEHFKISPSERRGRPVKRDFDIVKKNKR